MIKIVNLFVYFVTLTLFGCGAGSEGTSTVKNAHDSIDNFEQLRWSESDLPLVIKIPADYRQDSQIIDPLTSAINSWNNALSFLGVNAFEIVYFENIDSQIDLENSLLQLKCQASPACNCNEISCLTNYRPLEIADYLRDPNHVISKPTQWFSDIQSTTIAITSYSYQTSTNRIVNADIVLNLENYNFSDNPNNQEVDLESTFLHELGHFLGLKHVEKSVDPNSIMNPSLPKGEEKRTLSAGDIQYLESVYKN